MRRLLHYLINNIREHLMLYLFLWGLLAIFVVIFLFFFFFYFPLFFRKDKKSDFDLTPFRLSRFQ
ncbi:DUF2770 family protein [Escherichia coli]